jgi:predicted DNA-binding transcriptional regulator YafY
MLRTSVRLLRLLTLLQVRRDWSGPELARRLEVSTRTVRKDVERLRTLRYPVHAAPGVAGGYRLGAGAVLPPLLLEDDEAVVVAAGLRAAAGGALSLAAGATGPAGQDAGPGAAPRGSAAEGGEEAALRALAKLEQVLPARLRRRVNALHTQTVSVPAGVPAVDPEVLLAIAGACRDRQRLRFEYRAHDGARSRRDVEPCRLVCWGRRWYLLAWDTEREDWRTFRVDRIALRPPHGPRFAPRPPPAADVAAYVSAGVGSALWEVRATVLLHAPAPEVARRLPPWAGRVEAVDGDTCRLHTGADTPHQLALWLGQLDVDFELDVHDAPELAAHLRRLAARYLRATS